MTFSIFSAIFFYENSVRIDEVINPSEKILVFDLDNTLYPVSSGLTDQITKNYEGLLRDKFQVRNVDAIKEMAVSKFESFSIGLFRCFNITESDSRNTIFNLTYEKSLREDLELKKFLKSLHYRKVVMTNSPEWHTVKTLEILGLLDCFEAIFCSDHSNNDFIGKPMDGTFAAVEKRYNLKEKSNYIFFDDGNANILKAQKMGWTAVKVVPTKDLKDQVREVLKDQSDS